MIGNGETKEPSISSAIQFAVCVCAVELYSSTTSIQRSMVEQMMSIICRRYALDAIISKQALRGGDDGG
jgi:hypothetical protein